MITRKERKDNETLLASLIFLTLCYVYTSTFLMYVFDFTDVNFSRLNSVILIIQLILIQLWMKVVFVFPKRSFDIIQNLMLGYLIILAPISVLFSPDRPELTINYFLNGLVIFTQIIISIQLLFIGLYYWLKVSDESRANYLFLSLGIILVMGANFIFTIFYHPILQQTFQIMGYTVILIAFINRKFSPLLQFITNVNTGIMIISFNSKITYINQVASQYINSTSRKEPLLENLSYNNQSVLENAFNKTINQQKPVQVDEKLFNYANDKLENVRLSFFPLGIKQISDPVRIGMILYQIDEIEFLTQRKDFLFDIATHDIANVLQTLELSCEILEHDPNIIETMRKQINRLNQLVYSIQNLLIIDKDTKGSTEIDSELKHGFLELIEEKQKQNPSIAFIVEGLLDLGPIKTTGNLLEGFKLIIDGLIQILSSPEQKITIHTDVQYEKHLQSIIFTLKTKSNLSNEIFESYSRRDKSSLLSRTSSARVNLIVASAILQKNEGTLNISNQEEKTIINVQLPIAEI